MTTQYATHGELAEVPARLKQDLADMESRLKQDMSNMEARLQQEMHKAAREQANRTIEAIQRGQSPNY